MSCKRNTSHQQKIYAHILIEMYCLSRSVVICVASSDASGKAKPIAPDSLENLDTKARKWHDNMLAKKDKLESKRRERLSSLIQSLDKIAKDEVEEIKDLNSKKTKFNFDMPSITIKDRPQE